MTQSDLLHWFPSILDDSGSPPESLRPCLEELLEWDRDGRRWDRLRSLFAIETGLVYLNTGTLGACPKLVVEAHVAFIRRMELNPVWQEYSEMLPAMESTRRQAATLLGAGPDEIALTSCTTEGLSIVAGGIDLQSGDEVLMTTLEHPGGVAGWRNLAERRGIVIREMDLPPRPTGPGEILDAIGSAIEERTRVITLSHVNSITGLRMPIEEAAKLAAERGVLLIVDGAQSAGMVSIGLDRSGADAYAASGHKWLLGPKGSGILYVRRNSRDRIRPAFLQDGSAAYTSSTGTRNAPQIMALGGAVGFHRFLGPLAIESRVLETARLFRRRLAEIPELCSVGPSDPALDSALTTFTASHLEAVEVVERLERESRIAVKAVPRPHFDGHGIRVSTHAFNTDEDIDRLIIALKRMM